METTSPTSSAVATRARCGRTPWTTKHATTKETVISRGQPTNSVVTWTSRDAFAATTVNTAGPMPMSSAIQTWSPYQRSVSATSWPIVRSAGGAGGAWGLVAMR